MVTAGPCCFTPSIAQKELFHSADATENTALSLSSRAKPRDLQFSSTSNRFRGKHPFPFELIPVRAVQAWLATCNTATLSGPSLMLVPLRLIESSEASSTWAPLPISTSTGACPRLQAMRRSPRSSTSHCASSSNRTSLRSGSRPTVRSGCAAKRSGLCAIAAERR